MSRSDKSLIDTGIAKLLVGYQHASGTIVAVNESQGAVTVTSKCIGCGGERSGIPVSTATSAVRNPNQQFIPCSFCSYGYVVPTAAKEAYEDVIRIPENRRSSAQQRIIVEHENAERNQQREAVKRAPINAARAQANRAIKSEMWDSRERLLTAIAHLVGAQTVNDPRVLQDSDFHTWEAWQALSDEARDKANHVVDLYFANHGLNQSY
jgi:hypothetical protein